MCHSEHLTQSVHSQSAMNVPYGANEIVANWSINTATDEILKQPGDDPMILINANRELLNRESVKREDDRQKRINDAKDTVSLKKIMSGYPQMLRKQIHSNVPPTVTAKKLKMYGSPNQDDIPVASARWSYMDVFTWGCLPLLGILIACVMIRGLCHKWSTPGPVRGLDIRALDERPLNTCPSPARPSLPRGAAVPPPPNTTTPSTTTDPTVVSEFILDS